MADAEDRLVSELAVRLRDRKLYKCVDIRSRVTHEFDPESTGEVERTAKIESAARRLRKI